MLKRTSLQRKTPLRAKTALSRGTSQLKRTPLKARSKKRNQYEYELNKMIDLVKVRDHHSCIICGAPAQEIHHIEPRSNGGTKDIDNLCCVCWYCHHAVVHGPESKAIKKVLKKKVAERSA